MGTTKKTTTMKAFLKEWRREIDYRIRQVSGKGVANNRERMEWIMNDEHLYNFAKACGVKC